jgi:hypothetical protein
MALFAARVVLWSVTAFWLWLVFAAILRPLPLPAPSLVAAVLAWVVAGLTLRWTMPLATRWVSWVLQTMYG